MKRLLGILVLAIALIAVVQPVKAIGPLQNCLAQADAEFTTGFDYCISYGGTSDVILICLEANSNAYQHAMTECHLDYDN